MQNAFKNDELNVQQLGQNEGHPNQGETPDQNNIWDFTIFKQRFEVKECSVARLNFRSNTLSSPFLHRSFGFCQTRLRDYDDQRRSKFTFQKSERRELGVKTYMQSKDVIDGTVDNGSKPNVSRDNDVDTTESDVDRCKQLAQKIMEAGFEAEKKNKNFSPVSRRRVFDQREKPRSYSQSNVPQKIPRNRDRSQIATNLPNGPVTFMNQKRWFQG